MLAARFGNHRLSGWAARLEITGLLPLPAEIRIDRPVLCIEDVDLVVAIGLGEEYAELVIGKFEINVRIGELGDGFIPPSDRLLLTEQARDTKIESVFNEGSLAVYGGLVGRPAGVGDDGEQEQTEKSDRDADGRNEPFEIAADMIRPFVFCVREQPAWYRSHH